MIGWGLWIVNEDDVYLEMKLTPGEDHGNKPNGSDHQNCSPR